MRNEEWWIKSLRDLFILTQCIASIIKGIRKDSIIHS